MPWTERQQRMLAEMGLRVFMPPAAEHGPAVETADAPVEALSIEPVERPAPVAEALPQPVREKASAIAARQPSAPALPPEGRAATIAALDWTGLREAVADCRACSLCESRRQTVFGVGHPQADWMIVGEAPGEQEDQRGEPFVGPAGQLLDRMLQALGLSRGEGDAGQQVFIANTLKCRPPRNRNPLPEELAACEPYLLRQIALVQPKIVLAMGRFAVQALLRSEEPIGRLRGRVHRYAGVPLIVTYHPAYLLRNPIDKARAWDDLCLAAEVAGAGEGPEAAG